jgi:hypothetical protein
VSTTKEEKLDIIFPTLPREVNVLGTTYQVIIRNEKEDPGLKNCNGYCDVTSKKLIIADEEHYKTNLETPAFEWPTVYMEKVFRHELMHAVLYESGSKFYHDEELVDLLAIQLPKIKEYL